MVLPERPAGIDQMNEDEVAGLVTINAMIGVAQVQLDKRHRTRRLSVESPIWKVLLLCHAQVVSYFQAPWEGEAFAMAVALCGGAIYPWGDFQGRLIAAIAAADGKQFPPETQPTYYEHWLIALEALLIEKRILSKARIDRKATWLARAASGSHCVPSFPALGICRMTRKKRIDHSWIERWPTPGERDATMSH